MSQLVDPADLVSAADVADLLGVSAPAVSNYKQRYENFPKPVTTVARGKSPLYLRSEILAWYRGRMSDERLAFMRAVVES